CRNTLMYFNNETQGRILSRFHYALNESGALFLGKAEMLLTHTDFFFPVDLKSRIFQKVPQTARVGAPPRAEVTPETGDPMEDSSHIRDIAFEIDSVAQLVVDPAGRLILVNERARALFGIGLTDVGRPFYDLEVSFRPTDLRTAIQEAAAERRPVFRRDVPFPTATGDARFVDVQIMPMFASNGALVGAKI